MKHSDDAQDAFHLAHLLKLGILPEGYIYPKEERPVRDLLRKRVQLVQQKTSHILSFKNLVSRNLGFQMPSNDIKNVSEEDVKDMFKEEHLVLAGQANITTMHFLKERITEIEKAVLRQAKLREEYDPRLRNLTMGPEVQGSFRPACFLTGSGDVRRKPSHGPDEVVHK